MADAGSGRLRRRRGSSADVPASDVAHGSGAQRPAIVDYVAFAASLVLAFALEWRTADLVWSLWLSSLVIGWVGIVLGIARAKELVYTCRNVSGPELVELGIAMKCVEDEVLMDEARALATDLAAGPTWALGMTKKMFQFMCTPTLEKLLDHEALVQTHVRLSEDHREGVAAFREKRAPRFQGR